MPSHLQSLYPRLLMACLWFPSRLPLTPQSFWAPALCQALCQALGTRTRQGFHSTWWPPGVQGGAPFPGSLSARGLPKPSLSPFTFPDSPHLSPSRVGPLLHSTYQARMHAKSLQSCPTLCDPMHSSPPGSSVHRSLQARILQWVAISFSSTYHCDLTNYPCSKVAFCNHWFLSGLSTREKNDGLKKQILLWDGCGSNENLKQGVYQYIVWADSVWFQQGESLLPSPLHSKLCVGWLEE